MSKPTISETLRSAANMIRTRCFATDQRIGELEALADRLDLAGPPRVGDWVEYDGSAGVVVCELLSETAMFDRALGYVQIIGDGAIRIIHRAGYDAEAEAQE